jgi:hypothetical protein
MLAPKVARRLPRLYGRVAALGEGGVSDGGVIFGGPLEGGKTDREADEEPADVRVVVDDLSCGWVGGWVGG